MRVQTELSIDFRKPVLLSEIAQHKHSLLVHGIYVITEGTPEEELDPVAENVVYIGKAIKQTVYGRCYRHVQSVTDARSKTGNPLSGPGHSFKLYRERIDFDPSRLWVTPGVMEVDIPYAISCAEEYLLHQYQLEHGRYPWCNSAGQARQPERATRPAGITAGVASPRKLKCRPCSVQRPVQGTGAPPVSEDRSPEMVRLVYFLQSYGRRSPTGRYQPPVEFGDLNLREVYEQFFPRLGAGRAFKTFLGSAEGLRKGNVRERVEDGATYLPKYEGILGIWELLPREQQWAELQQYRIV